MNFSEYGLMYFRDQDLVWDDVIEHKQARVTPVQLRALADALEDRGTTTALLQGAPGVVDDDRADLERTLNEGWDGWNRMARLYSFASRMRHSDPVVTHDQSRERVIVKEIAFPVPGRFDSTTNSTPVALPDPEHLPERDFQEVLWSRRTSRKFSERAMTLEHLGLLLFNAASTRRRARTQEDVQYGNHYRNSPSGGARASTDLYLQVRNVDGLARGNYRYLADTHSLDWIGDASSDDDMLHALSRQQWFLECAVLIVLAADLQSTAWKYTDKRSYRSVILDAGHLNQNIYLVGTSLGLAVGTTAVQRDEDFEKEFNLSPALKVPLMLTGIGHHRDPDALTARVPTPLEQ
ncbi:SagB/ThcOx family dehydrogenase [Microbacterium sp. 22215]|uniref:SagB/ThcOx family dehydrogenase n=1 Tax=Microbacterium sp. 22215 TaxID=3453893 RepID=UPI003F85D840